MKKEYGMAAVAVFCWGTMAPVSKLLLADFTNMEVLGYGSAIAALTLLAVWLGTGRRRKRSTYGPRDYLRLAAIGTVGYFCYSACYYYGLTLLPAQTACILNYLWPIVTVCLSALLLKEPLAPVGIAALLLSFLGVVVILLPGGGRAEKGQWLGYGACLLAALLYGLFNVWNKKQGGDQLVNMTVYIGVSALLALLCGMRTGLHLPTAAQLPGLLWMGIFVDGAAFLLWAAALQRSRTASVANLAYGTPVVSLLLSAVFLREPIYLTSVVGLALILGGFFLQMRVQSDKPAQQEERQQ